jgi:hypothetical protein
MNFSRCINRIVFTIRLDLAEHNGAFCKIRQFIFYRFDGSLISNTTMKHSVISSYYYNYLFFIYVDLLCSVDVTRAPPHWACAPVIKRVCDLYNRIARLLATVFITNMLIFLFDYWIIRNFKTSRTNISSFRNV